MTHNLVPLYRFRKVEFLVRKLNRLNKERAKSLFLLKRTGMTEHQLTIDNLKAQAQDVVRQIQQRSGYTPVGTRAGLVV